MGLAGMEDAQIKSGNGMVERGKPEEEEMQAMSTAEYAKMRQANKPGTEVYDVQEGLRKSQTRIRSILEGRILKLAREDQRYQ